MKKQNKKIAKKKPKTKKDFIIWIKEQIKFYKPILGIALNNIGVKENSDTQYLEFKYTYPYVDSTIFFSNEAFNSWKKGDLTKDLILHELVHSITDPFYTKASTRYTSKNEIEDERERLTDTVTSIVRNLIK